jgi:hypothetical protein
MTKFSKFGTLYRRLGGSTATLVLLTVTLLGLGVSIAGLGALALSKPAPVAALDTSMADAQAAVAPERALLSSEVVVVRDPGVGVIWTMQVVPEDSSGREFTIKGTMEAPEGVKPGQEVNMRIYYTETISDNILDSTMDDPQLLTAAHKGEMVVASRMEYMVSDGTGSEWGYQVDLVPASLEPGPAQPAGWIPGKGAESFKSGLDESAPCDSRVHL